MIEWFTERRYNAVNMVVFTFFAGLLNDLVLSPLLKGMF